MKKGTPLCDKVLSDQTNTVTKEGVPMLNSIKYFEEDCINKFEELENEFLKHPEQIAEYVMGITQELHTLGLRMIQESLEMMDQMIFESPIRKRKWVVETRSRKQLITSLGTVHFQKTLYTNKESGDSKYLLDCLLGLCPHERMTDDAKANVLKEAVQSSYRRGGEEASLETDVSKQTVKNLLHSLEFPTEPKKPEEKKEVEYLYIDADEDHISKQFNQKKGDLVENENHQKNNCMIAKLVYVYEGIEREAPKSKRHKLVNPYYFSRVCSGEANLKFWDEVYAYLDANYDLEKVKRIYVNGDGGGWIKAGMKRISGMTYALDEFHLEKYLIKLTNHMLDEKDTARDELRRIIRKETKKEFTEKVTEPEEYQRTPGGLKKMEEAKEYILSNWTAAKIRLKHKDGLLGCSAEGHVSHVLSDRMSSRPMGWSVKGAANMVQLRAYERNGGDMLELVRYQSRELPKAAGAESGIISSVQMLRAEKSRHGEIGKYVDAISHSLSLDTKKKVYFNVHIWGL